MNSMRSVVRIAKAGIVTTILGMTCLSAVAQTAPQPTRADAEKDPVLKAMLTELRAVDGSLPSKLHAVPVLTPLVLFPDHRTATAALHQFSILSVPRFQSEPRSISSRLCL